MASRRCGRHVSIISLSRYTNLVFQNSPIYCMIRMQQWQLENSNSFCSSSNNRHFLQYISGAELYIVLFSYLIIIAPLKIREGKFYLYVVQFSCNLFHCQISCSNKIGFAHRTYLQLYLTCGTYMMSIYTLIFYSQCCIQAYRTLKQFLQYITPLWTN